MMGVPRSAMLFGVATWVMAAACSDGEVDYRGPVDAGGTGGEDAAGGQGGETPPDCVLGALGDCGPGEKCAVVDPQTGEVACSAAGNGAPWSLCQTDTNCPELTYCDALTRVCKPLCDSADDCAGEGRCVGAVAALGEPIPGLSLCTSGCSPLTGAPCHLGAGDVACVPHNPGDDVTSLDCVASAGGPVDTPCGMQTATSSQSDCAHGLVCVAVGGDNACKSWCTAPGQQAECAAGETCTDTGLTSQGQALGVCP